MQEDVGARLADDRRQRVEVVVVDHHDRVLLALDLLDDGLREVVVDGLVAVRRRRATSLLADVRRVGQVPQVVLDEPQHRVGDDVVEAVVGLGVGDDEAHVVLAAAACRTTNGCPPRSRDLRASPSVIADAIQTASRCDARPVSAVTSPPVPRVNEPSTSNVTGPRLETSTSGACPSAAVGRQRRRHQGRSGAGVAGLLRARAERHLDVARLAVAVDAQRRPRRPGL